MTRHWSEIDWIGLGDPEASWRRVLKRAREMWRERRDDSEHSPGVDSSETKDTDARDSDASSNPMGDVDG